MSTTRLQRKATLIPCAGIARTRSHAQAYAKRRHYVTISPEHSGQIADSVCRKPTRLTRISVYRRTRSVSDEQAHRGIMPVIKDHSPLGLGIMPDHACNRGAARLALGASRSQAYQPDADGRPAGGNRYGSELLLAMVGVCRRLTTRSPVGDCANLPVAAIGCGLCGANHSGWVGLPVRATEPTIFLMCC